MYIHRHLESILEKASKMFGAVLVTGPRQVGKTTLLRRFANSANYISLDDPMQLHAAVEQPATFLKIILHRFLWMKSSMRLICFLILKCR